MSDTTRTTGRNEYSNDLVEYGGADGDKLDRTAVDEIGFLNLRSEYSFDAVKGMNRERCEGIGFHAVFYFG